MVDIRPGYIDGHRDGRISPVVPLPEYGCSPFPHILVQLCDKAVLLEQRNKLSGRLKAPHRMLPPDKSLCPRKPVVPDPVLGLQIDLKLLLGKGRLHAVRYGLFPQKTVAKLIVIGREIRSIPSLNAAGSQKGPVAHLLHRHIPVSHLVNPPLHHHIPGIGKGIYPGITPDKQLICVIPPPFQKACELVRVEMAADSILPGHLFIKPADLI